jgi:hypothetical protein
VQLGCRHHNEDVLLAALGRLSDPEGMVRIIALKTVKQRAQPGDIVCVHTHTGMVRIAALKTIKKLALPGDREVIEAVMKLVSKKNADIVANVRREVCSTLAVLAEKGLPPSRIYQASGTALDKFSKVLAFVTLDRKCTWALTFQKCCRTLLICGGIRR